MSIRPIIYFGDERLIVPSQEIIDFDSELQVLIDDMFETMYASDGIGLAAPQLGINWQLTVIDITKDKSTPWCLINPRFLQKEGQSWMEEGCLSIPGAYDLVLRPDTVKIAALDRYGKPINVNADGLFARCIQHEYDHLQGKLFIDHLSPVKRQRAIDKYLKTRRQLKQHH